MEMMRYKLVGLLALLLSYTATTVAQRISSFELEGVTSLAPCCSFTPTNNDESSPGDLQIVYPSDADLSDRVATLGGTFTIDTDPMPTDWRTTQNIQLTNGSNTAWYDIACKLITPSTLPFLMNTTVSYIAEAWSGTTQGWAASCIQREKDHVRFGNAYASFLVAFTDVPDSVSYSINFAADEAAEGTVFDVEESSDGVLWSSVMQWTAENIPTNLSTDVEKYHAHKLLATSRYVRWHFSTRVSGSISLTDMLKVTSAADAAAIECHPIASSGDGVLIAPNPVIDMLRIHTTQEIATVTICNLVGQVVAIYHWVEGELSVANLPSGSYLAIVTCANGEKTVKRFIKK